MTQNSPTPDPSSLPPLIARPVRRELLSQDFQAVLQRLEQRYGTALRVNVTDASWAEISVENVPAVMLAAQLQSERKVLFGEADPRVQVIQPLRPMGNIICIHLLTDPEWGSRSMMAMSK